jgi:hypothetical protein
LDRLFDRFTELDGEFSQQAVVPADINAALRFSAQCSVHSGLRDSVRGLLTDTSSALGGLRARLDALVTVLIGVAALVLSLIAIAVDVFG